MKERYGIQASQAAVFRDLRALGIGKRISSTQAAYELSGDDASKEILRLAIANIQHNESLIVIHTLPGLAAFVADYLDLCSNTGIMGTLAGENTVFVTPELSHAINKVYKTVCQLLYFKQTPKDRT